MATDNRNSAPKAVPKRFATKAAPARPKVLRENKTEESEPKTEPEVKMASQPTHSGDRAAHQAVNTQGDTMSTIASTGKSSTPRTVVKHEDDPTADDNEDDDQSAVATDKPKSLTKKERARRADLGRVSLVTLHQAVMHMQGAEGMDRLQRALGLPESGYPNDELVATIVEYRNDHDLGPGVIDAELLQHLGFEVNTI